MYSKSRMMPRLMLDAKQQSIRLCHHHHMAISLLLLISLFCTAISQRPSSSSTVLSSNGREDSQQQQNPLSSSQELPNGRRYPQQPKRISSQWQTNPNLQQQSQRNTDELSLDSWPTFSSQNNYVKPAGMRNSDVASSATNTQAKPGISSNSTLALNNNPQPDTFSDGSGNGPVPASRQLTGKFDDTEEGDDDEDEDDYDYGDSGSGHKQQTSAKKQDSELVLVNNVMRKPSLTDGDPYLPFRPPANISLPPPTTSMPNRYTSNQANDSFSELSRISSTINQVNSISSNVDNILPQPTPRSTTVGPEILPSHTENRSTYQPTTPRESFESTNQTNPARTTAKPINVLDDRLKTTPTRIPDKFITTDIYDSSLSRPTTASKSEPDYEYDDENEDDDSEDTSNFEDNEPQDVKVFSNSTTISASVFPVTNPPAQIKPRPVPSNSTIATIHQVSSSSNPPPTKQPVFNSTVQTNNSIMPRPIRPVAADNRSTTIAPSRIPPSITDPPLSTDEEDDDEDENDDDEEEFEEELDEEDEEDEEPASEFNPGSIPQQNTQSPLTPTRYEPNHGHHIPPRIGSTHDPVNPSPSPKQQLNNYARYPVHPLSNSPEPSIEITTSSTVPPTSTKGHTPATTTTTTSTTTTSTTTSTTTTQKPKLPTHMAPTNPKPSYHSSTTVPSVLIKYATTPRARVATVVTRTTSYPAYDKNLSNDDTDLTREIYDKAMEVYHTTNKAISAAIEAIWPTTFEMNSSTFEPLLNQPMLLMFTLGAVVIGLVLTMMLVVYIVTYQIQPKDDDISIY